jgi:ATP-dependent DNA helicase RecQ
LDLESFLPKFGLTAFRPGQREVISAVLAGEDCLCVMPTGSGKSLCYQLPAVAREGVTLVVSPLIALMQDQVDQLLARGLRATFINSMLEPGELSARLNGLGAGAYDLVYVVPERFRSPRFLEAVRRVKLQLLAVDEAHCISEWGHDFRPDYAKLGRFRERLGNPPTIALTATATSDVRRDIITQLQLRSPRVFVTGFARPNLFYAVESSGGQRVKQESLVSFLSVNPGCGIVYASTRKKCEEVAEMIVERTGRRAGIYHAGMQKEDRRKAQDSFMQGKMEIVVATTAFGMGVDKRDVRFVVHYNLPGSLEGYYQEAGRAGRDGLPSKCLLLYTAADRMIQEYFIESAYPAPEVVQQVYNYLRSREEDPIELTQQELRELLYLKIGAEGIGTCEQLLEKAGVLERLEARQNMAIVKLDSELPTLVDLLPQQATAKRRVLRAVERLVGDRRGELVYFHPRELLESAGGDSAALSRMLRELCSLSAFDYVPPFRGRAIHMLRKDQPFSELEIDFETLAKRKAAEYARLDQVIRFAQSRRCRQLEILHYFGEPAHEPCGHCDNCVPVSQSTATRAAGQIAKPSLETVRIVLSGVARTKGRVGKTIVAQMLCGSRSEKVSSRGLDQLSTFGLLSRYRRGEVVALLDQVIAAGYVEQIEEAPRRPIVRLTAQGLEVMRGNPPREIAPAAEPIGSPPKPSLEPGPPEPDVSVASDVSSPAAEPAASNGHPPHYWTWRLLLAGFRPDECAAIRGLTDDQVWQHALCAAQSGWPVDADWYDSPHRRKELQQARRRIEKRE